MASNLKVNNILPTSGGGTVNLGASGDTITVPSGTTLNVSSATLSGITQGITMADQWRLTADTNSGTDADITSNWERNDSASYGSIGTGLTESSGIFSFPQTGIYHIFFSGRFTAAINDTSVGVRLYTTTDNSTYVESSRTGGGNPSSSTGIASGGTCGIIFDVTDITTHKFKFDTFSFSSGTNINGSTSSNFSFFTVIRLGDT